MYKKDYCGSNVQHFAAPQPIVLECGRTLHDINIAYHTYGKLNAAKDNAVWICHAFSANSDVADWWTDMVGEDLLFDTSRYFVICANVLGSCYGTTGPLSLNPQTNQPYYLDFPEVTVRDMVAAHEQLLQRLDIQHINTIVGGSIGAFQALEWAVSNPDLFDNLVFSAAGAKTTPWVVAVNEAQRMAIEADQTFFKNRANGGEEGMKAARAMALLSYRNYATYNTTQREDSHDKINGFRASSYQRYQGQKLANRFDAYTYYRLSQSIDSFDVGRGRGSVEEALAQIKARSIVIGISSDILFPTDEQKWVAKHIPNAVYAEVESQYGHDGFLIEHEKLTEIIGEFLKK